MICARTLFLPNCVSGGPRRKPSEAQKEGLVSRHDHRGCRCPRTRRTMLDLSVGPLWWLDDGAPRSPAPCLCARRR